MFQIALRGLRQNPFRYIATALAIILGVTFFTGTSVVTSSFRDTISDSIAEAFEDVDAVVRSSDAIETPFGDIRSQIPFDLTDSILQVDGVADAAPFLTGYAQIVGADGKTLGGGGASPPQGFAWLGDSDLNPYQLVGDDSRAPESPFEVVVDGATLDDAGYAVGDQVRVLPMPEDQLYTVVGQIESVSDNDFGGQVLAFSFDGARAVFGTSDVDQIVVDAAEGVSDDQLAANLDAAIDAGDVTSPTQGVDTQLEAITGADFAIEIEDLVGTFISIIDTALKVFAGIALFVGAFVIYNTFSITVAQRQQEMALLRAIGASVRQVSRSVLLESVIVGAIASLLGAIGGVGLGWLLLKLLEQLADDFSIGLAVPPGTLVGGVILGTVITIVAAWLPARRGARVPPVQAMRETAVEDPEPSRTRGMIGVAMMAIGAALTIVTAIGSGSGGLFGLGIVVLVVGVVVSGPIIVRPMSKVISFPLTRGGSIIGELARENSARNPKRSATTSLTLMIGVALVVTATVFAATLRESIRGELEDQMIGDYVVEISPEIAAIGGGLDPAIAAQVAEVPGVEASVPSRNTTGQIDGDFVQLQGVATSQIEDVFRFDALEGTLTDLGADQIAVAEDTADDRNLVVGDTVRVQLQQSTVDLTVAGIFDPAGALASWVVDTVVLDEHTLNRLDSTIFIATADDAGEDTVVDVESVLATDPTARVETTKDYIDDQAGSINQLLILLYGLLAMSVVVALIGIVNTMALSIHERTRELGVLRAVGMTARQLRRTIRYESTIIALIGTFVGMILGVFFGWLVSKLTEDVFPAFTVPWASLVAIAVVGIVAGFLAGVLPARRAGKLNVLDAIAGE